MSTLAIVAAAALQLAAMARAAKFHFGVGVGLRLGRMGDPQLYWDAPTQRFHIQPQYTPVAAMDPANQSLADALRLSYRILQTAIVGLAIVFVFSGFQTVAENSTGVRTLFGAIEGKGDDAQLEPGLQPFWPYPIGEIVTVPLRRNVRIDHAFWPRLASDQMTIDQATDAASVNTPIRPGGDGSLMLRNGDLAHARIEAEYEIEDAVAFLDQFTPEQADEVVKLSLERASVQVAASSTLTSFLEQREEANANIASIAQATLDDIGTGIRLVNVSSPIASLRSPFVNRWKACNKRANEPKQPWKSPVATPQK